MQIQERALSDIKSYHNNPRNNESAVDAVAESIKQCGYCAPIIVDEDGVILAGHTRLKALTKLGWERAEVVVKEGLTDEQKRKYRLLDNKVGELATWDFEALQMELEDMDFQGFEFGFQNSEDDKYGTDFNLPSGEKEPFTQMTFTLADKQAELIKTAMQTVKGDIVETFGNENGNGNALYEVVRQWAQQRE